MNGVSAKPATAVKPGDEVRVSGVKVGTIDKIEPEGTLTAGAEIPADRVVVETPTYPHAYEAIAADTLARFKRLDGFDVRARTTAYLTTTLGTVVPFYRLEKAGAPDEAHLTGPTASALREALLRVEGSTREGVAELRTILAVLRDPHEGPESAEEEPGLARTLRLTREMERAGLTVRWELAVPEATWETLLRTMGLPAQLAFLRMAQESLTNAAKHAGSGTAAFVVRLRAEAGLLEGEVTDDGGGPAPVGGVIGGTGGRGLRGLRERAEAHGGHATWGPRVGGRGWFVRFALPLPPEEAHGQLEAAQGVSRG